MTGWRWVFLVNVPIAVAALVVVIRTLHLHHYRRDHRIDWWGAGALTVALVPLLIVAEQGREWGWTSGLSFLCYAIGVAGLITWFFIERSMGDEALIPLRLFKNRTVAVASITSVFVGMGMFGGLAALPLYLQIVKGATPTQAGLQLLPMMLGIMFGSILSGQLISRTGRYRQYPIIGAGLLVVALWMFHYVEWDTPLWKTMLAMVMFGIGLGFNFQPLTLAIQNAVSPLDIGVATSSATFTRQIGGTLGTAIFLSILFSSARDKIGEAFQTLARGSDFLAALRNPVGDPAANAAFIQQVQAAQAAGTTDTAFGGALNDSSFLQLIDPRLAAPFLVGFSQAMSVVFLVASFILVIAFVTSWFLPHVELRSGSAYDQRNAEMASAASQDNGAPVQSREPVAAGAVVGGRIPSAGDGLQASSASDPPAQALIPSGRHEGAHGNGSGPNGAGPVGKHESAGSEPDLAAVSGAPDGESSQAKPAGRYVGRHRG